MLKSQTGLAVCPAHPGEILKQDVVPLTGMTIGQIATHLGVARATLSELLNEKLDVSHDMAIRLGKACGNRTRFWLALQMQFDLWQMEQERTFQIDVARLELDAALAS